MMCYVYPYTTLQHLHKGIPKPLLWVKGQISHEALEHWPRPLEGSWLLII